MLLILVTTLASLAIDPDETLRILRRLSFRSALTASLATRMIPVLAADAQRLAEAQRTRPSGPPRGARGRIVLLRAVIGGSLDRAMDVAATLEVRGFATARRAPRISHPFSRHDAAFLASAVLVLALALLGRLTNVARFDAYPEVHAATGVTTVVLAAGLLTAVLLPFADRKGIER
jgi:energy-coupling factor transport system permease protein